MRNKAFAFTIACLALWVLGPMTEAAFMVEAHSSGRANATNFTGTGVASIPSTAPGVKATKSIFGGSHDYLFAYTPALDMDNYSPAAGTDLTNGHASSGLMGGLSGKYNVYITWPASENVDAAGCTITVTNDADDVALGPVNMNTGKTGSPGGNNGWYRIAEKVHLTAGIKYTVRQKANSGTYVSQRSHGVMWELVEPDPLPISLTETNGTTAVSEGGNSDEYIVTMLEQPQDSVQVIVIANDPNQVLLNGTMNQTTLTFTAANWETPQTIQVVANDDLDVENDHFTWLKHYVMFTDDPNSLFAGFLKVTIADNEAPGVLIVESDGATSVDEQGPTSDTYTVRLMMAPTAPVTITITPDADTEVSPTQLVFTAADWDINQTVTVTAVDDQDSELIHTSTITHKVTSADPGYNNLTVGNVVVTVADNDCGVWGYSPMDFTKDCVVDIEDFAAFAAEWIICTTPYVEGCVNQLAP